MGKWVETMTVESAKANLLKVLAHPVRLAATERLGRQEMAVGELAQALKLDAPALSSHLAELRNAGLVIHRQEKGSVYYRVEDPKVTEMLSCLTALTRRQLEKQAALLGRLNQMP